MLSQKPWRPDLVLRLLIGLFASMLLGVIIVGGYSSGAEKDRDFLIFIVGVFSFHGVGLVLVDVFLRQHKIGWLEAFGFNQPRFGRAIFMAVILGILMLPIAWSLSELSSRILRLLQMPVEAQQAVQVLQRARGDSLTLFYHGIAAILLAPFVEELVFRGILYPAIKQHGYHKLALWGTSMFFAIIHGNLVIFVPLTVLAIFLTFLYETTNNLLAPILTHSFFNAVNYFYLISMQGQPAP